MLSIRKERLKELNNAQLVSRWVIVWAQVVWPQICPHKKETLDSVPASNDKIIKWN